MEVCHTQTLQIRAGEGKRLIKAVNNRFNRQMPNATAQQVSIDMSSTQSLGLSIGFILYPVTEAQISTALLICFTVNFFFGLYESVAKVTRKICLE